MRKIHLSRKQWAIVAVIIALVATNITLAYEYMNKDVTISGGVKTVGAIAVYKEDGITELTTIAIPLFEGSTQTNTTMFYIKNTGNVQANVYWLMSSSSPAQWSIESGGAGYLYKENSADKYRLSVNKQILPDGSPGGGAVWAPDPAGTQFFVIGPGQSAKVAMDLVHYMAVNTPGTFSFVLSFYT